MITVIRNLEYTKQYLQNVLNSNHIIGKCYFQVRVFMKMINDVLLTETG